MPAQIIFANGYKVFGGTTAEWAAHDDPLYYRELGIEYTDDGRVLMKAGVKTADDSPTPWSQLPYVYGPAGPSPDFEWDGTSIRFKKPDGTWGEWVDLKGPKGDQGDTPEIAGSAYLILDDRAYTDEEVRAAVEALDLPDGTICSVWVGEPGTDGGTGGGGGGGEPGKAATVDVGTTTTLPPGADATVTNSGTTSAAVLNFGIPRGEKGVDGVSGASSCLVDYTKPVNVPLTQSEDTYTLNNAGVAPIDGLAVATMSMTDNGTIGSRYYFISVNGVKLYSGRLATASGGNGYCIPFTVKKGDAIVVAASKSVNITYSVQVYPFINTSYSTDEQVIGTWIDRKPLYRKVIIPNMPTEVNVSAETDVSDLNIDTLVKLEGFHHWSNGNFAPMNYSYTNPNTNAQTSSGLALNYWNKILITVNKSNWLNATGQIILEYTKTTDSAPASASLLSGERLEFGAEELASAAEAISAMTKSSLEL